jgi:AcrR family transcriptional regulator
MDNIPIKQKILETAFLIANKESFESLTAASITKKLKITPPALYKHYNSLNNLKEIMAVYAFREIEKITKETLIISKGEEALILLGKSYREFAKSNPSYFEATHYRTKKENTELGLLRESLIVLLSRVFQDMKLESNQILFAIRTFRSLVFGFIYLESKNSFGLEESLDKSFHFAIQVFIKGIKNQNLKTKRSSK